MLPARAIRSVKSPATNREGLGRFVDPDVALV
jgi:hypothetical protein